MNIEKFLAITAMLAATVAVGCTSEDTDTEATGGKGSGGKGGSSQTGGSAGDQGGEAGAQAGQGGEGGQGVAGEGAGGEGGQGVAGEGAGGEGGQGVAGEGFGGQGVAGEGFGGQGVAGEGFGGQGVAGEGFGGQGVAGEGFGGQGVAGEGSGDCYGDTLWDPAWEGTCEALPYAAEVCPEPYPQPYGYEFCNYMLYRLRPGVAEALYYCLNDIVPTVSTDSCSAEHNSAVAYCYNDPEIGAGFWSCESPAVTANCETVVGLCSSILSCEYDLTPFTDEAQAGIVTCLQDNIEAADCGDVYASCVNTGEYILK